MAQLKEKKWFSPVFEVENEPPNKRSKIENNIKNTTTKKEKNQDVQLLQNNLGSNHNWMKNFDPATVEDLAVNNKKVQEVDAWLKNVINCCNSDMLVLTGPVGCGKTATIMRLAAKYNVKVSEWITPVDIDIPNDYGDYEYKDKKSAKFLEYVINAANFTSLLDSNSNKLVLVEDFPNTFIKSPNEFTDVVHQYKQRAKSPMVFICSDSNTDNRNSAANLFTSQLKEQFGIHHITFNGASATGLKGGLKRVADIMNQKFTSIYNVPSADLIECVVNSSAGDIRSAILNLHFASLKGSNHNLETSVLIDKENTKKTVKKKKGLSKFSSIGKDQTVSILHGVGRVLNPKVIVENNVKKFTHSPCEVIEQFTSQPGSFISFIEENYLPHFSSIDHAQKAATYLSDADYMIAEWRERVVQEYGVYVATAGLMTANEAPVSAWNPVRGPKNMKIQYPTTAEMPELDQDLIYNGKVLVSDYKTFYNIIKSSIK